MRKRPPATRAGRIHKTILYPEEGGEIEIYVTINRYDDEPLIAEIFINVAKQGSTLQGLVDAWAIMVSVALQYGVPLDKVVDKFTGHSFPPYGRTSDARIPTCSSILDYVVQLLANDSRS